MKFSLTIGLAGLAIGINAKELQANLIQKASIVTGQQDGKANPEQVNSDTSDENFINVCAGKTLTNGKQIDGGSCNGIPMGDIPSKDNMVSSIIIFPKTGEPIKASQSFDIKVKVSNMVTGFFTNPLETYYAAPQKLQGGKVVGHTHVTVQDMGNTMNPDTPLAPDKFSFFKGINAKADGNGVLTATVSGGLPVGKYRVCTLTSAANHQAVIMPIAQRGAQDDCTKFEVTAAGGGGGGNNGAGGNNGGGAAKKDNAKNKTKKDDDDDDKAKDAKAKDAKAKDAKANDAKDKDAKDKDAKAKDAKAKDDKAKDAKANDAKDKDAKAKDAKANDAKAKDDKAKDVKANEVKANEVKANEADKIKTGGGKNDNNSDAAKANANAVNNGKNKEENKAKSNATKTSGKNGDDDDNDDDKPKAADNKSKKSTERAEKRAGVTNEDCQTLAKRATSKNIENTDNLEGENENKKVIHNQKRFSRVFIS